MSTFQTNEKHLSQIPALQLLKIKGTLVLCERIVGGDFSRHCSGWTGEQTLL